MEGDRKKRNKNCKSDHELPTSERIQKDNNSEERYASVHHPSYAEHLEVTPAFADIVLEDRLLSLVAVPRPEIEQGLIDG